MPSVFPFDSVPETRQYVFRTNSFGDRFRGRIVWLNHQRYFRFEKRVWFWWVKIVDLAVESPPDPSPDRLYQIVDLVMPPCTLQELLNIHVP